MDQLSDSDYDKKRYTNNIGGRRDRVLANAKARYNVSREKILSQRKERWRNDSECRAKVIKRVGERYIKNADAIRQYGRDYSAKYRNSPEFKAARQSNPKAATEWRKKNPSKANAAHRRYYRKILSTPGGAINHRIGVIVRSSLKSEGVRKSKVSLCGLLGYTGSQLRTHLKSRFMAGMTWDALMRGEIHIDHIIPKSFFKFESVKDIEFRRCWALENLQPLWASDNSKKKNKLLAPAQIALGV